MLGLAILYISTIKKSLNRCAPENRFMAPGMVWLMLIPFVNIVWHFFVVINVAKSLGAEFQKRGIVEDAAPGKILGLIMCILRVITLVHRSDRNWLNWIYRAVDFHDFSVTNVSSFDIGLFLCWILYWVRIARFSAKIAA